MKVWAYQSTPLSNDLLRDLPWRSRGKEQDIKNHEKPPRKPKKISSGCCKSPRSGCGTKAFTSSASSSPCALNGGCHDDQNWILLASQKCSQVYQNYMHHPKRDGHPVFASEWKTAFVVAPLFQYGVWVGAIAVKLQ